MTTSIQLTGSTQAQPQLNTEVATKFAAKAPTTTAQISEAAKEKFAAKAAVGEDLQNLHKSIEAAVERLNAILKDSGRSLNIGIDHALGGPVVTVRSAESGDVVRQIPNEVVVKMAHSIEAFKGWLHDDNA